MVIFVYIVSNVMVNNGSGGSALRVCYTVGFELIKISL